MIKYKNIRLRSVRPIGMIIETAFNFPYSVDLASEVLKDNIETFTPCDLEYLERVILEKIRDCEVDFPRTVINEWTNLLQVIYVFQEVNRRNE